jgi:hypothetical protein
VVVDVGSRVARTGEADRPDRPAGALDDELVRETVEHLPHAQAARVALFNLRCTGDPTAPPVWLDHEAREIAG